MQTVSKTDLNTNTGRKMSAKSWKTDLNTNTDRKKSANSPKDRLKYKYRQNNVC